MGYMLFRTWSHYRAFKGGKYLEALLSRNLVTPTASKELDAIYAAGLPNKSSHVAAQLESEDAPLLGDEHGESMLLKQWNGKLIAEAFKLPEMEVEISRAVGQVELMVHGEVKAEEHELEEKVTEKQ